MKVEQLISLGLVFILLLPLVRAEYVAPKLSVAESFTYKPCEVTQLNFLVKNVGISKGEIKFFVSGDASKWINIPSSVILESGEEKLITGLISVPCNVTGEHNFTLSAATAIALDYQESKIAPIEGRHFNFFPIVFWILVILLVIFCFVKEFVILNKRKIPESF